MSRFGLFGLIFLIISSCQTLTFPQSQQAQILHDEAFAGFENYSIETEKEIFQLSQEAKSFAHNAIQGHYQAQAQITALISHIFARSKFNLLYRSDANTTAQKTFENRAANCLSLSIMTYALAKELGFSVRFQDIDIPEYWTRREGHRLLNSHINLQIIPTPPKGKVEYISRGFEVDFDVQSTRARHTKKPLTLNQVIGLFYNNKGSDALLNNDYKLAYAYYRAAYLVEPNQAHLLANIGYLYRLNARYDYAELAYHTALNIDPDNLTAWQNLAFLYRHLGQLDKSEEVLARLSVKRSSNPYYHLSLGDAEFENGHYQTALSHYRDALAIDNTIHEIFFSLAKTYFELGELHQTARFLNLAKKTSQSEYDQHKYQGKIELLRRLNSGDSTS